MQEEQTEQPVAEKSVVEAETVTLNTDEQDEQSVDTPKANPYTENEVKGNEEEGAVSEGARPLSENERTYGGELEKRQELLQTIRGEEIDATVKGADSSLIRPGVRGFELYQRSLEGTKVTDDKGQPHIWFHGTRSSFSEFKIDRQRQEIDGMTGIYLTSSPNVADSYHIRMSMSRVLLTLLA